MLRLKQYAILSGPIHFHCSKISIIPNEHFELAVIVSRFYHFSVRINVLQLFGCLSVGVFQMDMSVLETESFAGRRLVTL